MADIPPNIAASGAQAGFQQAEVSCARDAQKASSASAAQRGVKAIDDAGSTIEAAEDDVSVFADAEGAGGQGRYSEEESHEGQEADDNASTSSGGISTDSEGKKHLDIQA